MTERLQRVHTILRSGHVPCALSSTPGGGVALHAGNQVGGVWDVLVRDTDGKLWIVDARGTAQLPRNATDAAIGDAVKLHIVQAWADQGDPEAQALITALRRPAQDQRSAAGRPTDRGDTHVSLGATAQFIDPLLLAGQMFEAANRLGSAFLTPPAWVALTVWSPWGAVQVGYTRR